MTAIAARKMDDKKPEPVSAGSMIATKFISGTFGGLCQAVCSHPFDVIKSRIQTGQFPTIGSCIKATLKDESPLGFYKGVQPPIVIAGAFNASLFASNEAAKSIVRTLFSLDAEKPMGLQYICLAGVMAAPVCCVVLTPGDVIKINLQLQRESSAQGQYKGMIDCTTQLYKKDGLKALFRGYVPTLMTRVFGLPGFFAGAEVGGRWYGEQFPHNSEFSKGLFKGWCAGCLFWLLAMPADNIKTKVMGQGLHVEKRGPMQVARDIFAANGLRGFYRGFGAAMLRSSFANPAVFAGISVCEGWMKK